MASVGYMNEISKRFEWRIPHFFPHLEEFNEYFYNSPKFLFNGESWFLALYPNGHRESNSTGYVSILLFRCCSGPSLSLKFSISLKSVEGKKEKETYCRYTFRDGGWGFGASHCISRAELFEKTSELLPSNVLTVIFAIKYSEVVEVERKFCDLLSYTKSLMM